MEKTKIIFALLILSLLFSGCSADRATAVEAIADISAEPAVQENLMTAAELSVHAADVARRKIFDGCTIGIMAGDSGRKYAEDVAYELTWRLGKMGYTVGKGQQVEIALTDGDAYAAEALLTDDKVVLVICCDMVTTERLLYTDNEYRVIGDKIAAVGMNETECKKIEHR